MLNIVLTEITKENISKIVGISFDELIKNIDDYEEQFVKCTGFSKERNLKRFGRGNPLLARKKIRTLNDVETKLRRK